MVEIDWTLIAYGIIALFALSGFFRGWWKEAIATFFLGILILLLRMPELAQQLIDGVNEILRRLPASLRDFLVTRLGLTLQIDAGSTQTWLVILILLLGLAIILSRYLLPNHLKSARVYQTYVVTPMGGILGGLLGGLNGFLLVNLVREYLDGRYLPSGGGSLATEIVAAGGPAIGIASSDFGIEVTDLPNFTIMNNLLGWIVVGLGLLMFLLVVNSRVNIPRVGIPRWPRGYTRTQIYRDLEKDKIVPTVVESEGRYFWVIQLRE